MIAMGVAGIDLLAKSVLIFGFRVRVFVEEPGLHSRAYFWVKWGYWGAGLHRGARLRRPYRAPENAVPRPGCPRGRASPLHQRALPDVRRGRCAPCASGRGEPVGRYCVFGLCNYAYYACYPPVLYLTFLADYFREDEYEVESRYYSEMEGGWLLRRLG